MYVSSWGGLNQNYRRKSRKFPWKRHSVNPNLFDSITLSPDRNNWTKTINNSTCSITYTEKGKIPTSRTTPKQEETTLAVPFQMFLGTTLKAATSRWGFCSGAFTTHLGRRHDAKEHRASGTTHIRRCLATEILSRNFNVRSVE